MLNLGKICRLLSLAVFLCPLICSSVHAQALTDKGYYDDLENNIIKGNAGIIPGTQATAAQSDVKAPLKAAQQKETVSSGAQVSAPNTGVATNTPPSSAQVTGCSSDLGLFSGLITTGGEIFKGLRDLIYVVAGFGIIGVAVGGFFGNLNWKWLGAIVIGLVVIATTGELINAITGCEGFTTQMITDTLK